MKNEKCQNNEFKHELKLLNLLGLSLNESEIANKWLVVNNTGKPVGYLKRKRNKGNSGDKKEFFGFTYELFLKNGVMTYHNFRNSMEEKNEYKYVFDRVNGNFSERVFLDFGEEPKIFIQRENDDFMFLLKKNRLYLNFKSKTVNYKMEEILNIFLDKSFIKEEDYDRTYDYSLSFCPLDEDLEDSPERTTFVLYAKYRPTLYYNDEKKSLKIIDEKWVNGEKVSGTESLVRGKISDVISLHEDGINSFMQFKILFNSMFPYCDDAMELLLEEYNFEEEEFRLITGKNQNQVGLSLKKDS